MKFRNVPLRYTLASVLGDVGLASRNVLVPQVRLTEEDGTDVYAPRYQKGSITIWLEGAELGEGTAGAYLVNLAWLHKSSPKVHRLVNGVYNEVTDSARLKLVCELALDVAEILPETIRGLGFTSLELDTDRIRLLLREYLRVRWNNWE